ncbi:MAG: tetratricopeptide repeat protein [Bacteroidota bacterium]
MNTPSLLSLMVGMLLMLPSSVAQTLATYEHESPIIWANSVSAAYGFDYTAILQLTQLFEEQGLSADDRRETVVRIVATYRENSEAAHTHFPGIIELNQWLGDLASDQVIEILTFGDGSPIVIGDHVTFSYGLSVEAFMNLYEFIEQREKKLWSQTQQITHIDRKFQSLEEEFKQLLRRYQSLNQELANRSDQLAKQAKVLLKKGKIHQAIELLGKRSDGDLVEAAISTYDYGQSLMLMPSSYHLAMEKLALAVQLSPTQAEFLNAYAESLRTLGRFSEAIPLYQQAIGHYKTSVRDADTVLSSMYTNLASSFYALGQTDTAIQYVRRSIDIDSALLGSNHPLLATGYNNLATYLKFQGQYKLAFSYYQKSLEIDLKHLGESHQHIATIYNNLGSTLEYTGDYDQAMTYYQKAIRIYQKCFSFLEAKGIFHPLQSVVYGNMGTTLFSLGKLADSKQYLTRALEIDTTIFGRNHTKVALDYNNLAAFFHAINAFDSAITYYHIALDILTPFEFTDPLKKSDIYANLGGCWQSLGQYQQAIELHQMAFKIDTSLGASHPKVGRDYQNLGVCYYSLFQYEKALDNFHQALVIYLQTYQRNHPLISKTLRNIASTLINLQAYHQAIDSLQAAMVIDSSLFGMTHPEVARNYATLGLAYYHMEEFPTAIHFFNLTLAIDTVVYPRPNQYMSNAFNNLGASWTKLGQLEKAIHCHQKGLKIDQGLFGEASHPSIAIGLNNLALLFIEVGKYAEAVRHHQEAYRIFLKFFDPNISESIGMERNMTKSILVYGKQWLNEQQYDSALYYSQLGLSHAHHVKDDTLIRDFFILASESYFDGGQIDSSQAILDEGLHFFYPELPPKGPIAINRFGRHLHLQQAIVYKSFKKRRQFWRIKKSLLAYAEKEKDTAFLRDMYEAGLIRQAKVPHADQVSAPLVNVDK